MRTLRIVVSAVLLAAVASIGASAAQAEAVDAKSVSEAAGWQWQLDGWQW